MVIVCGGDVWWCWVVECGVVVSCGGVVWRWWWCAVMECGSGGIVWFVVGCGGWC